MSYNLIALRSEANQFTIKYFTTGILKVRFKHKHHGIYWVDRNYKYAHEWADGYYKAIKNFKIYGLKR